jgi:hypothetical protein
MWRHLAEYAVTGNQRGVGRLGAEYWHVLKDKRGRRKGRIYARYPQSNWRNLDIYTSLLAPGPTGPAATHHLEHLREGVLECEARIQLEAALADDARKEQLGDDLAQRCRAALDEHLRCMHRALTTYTCRLDYPPTYKRRPAIASHLWFVGSGWEARRLELFNLAGEVARKLGGN